MNDKCVGTPIDWTGGELAFCNAPVQIGIRFCNRCHLLAIGKTLKRVEQLRVSLAREETELANLIRDCI